MTATAEVQVTSEPLTAAIIGAASVGSDKSMQLSAKWTDPDSSDDTVLLRWSLFTSTGESVYTANGRRITLNLTQSIELNARMLGLISGIDYKV